MNKNSFIKNSYNRKVSLGSTPSSSKSKRHQVFASSSELKKIYHSNRSKKYSESLSENQQSFSNYQQLQRSLLCKNSRKSIKSLSQSLQIAQKKISILNEKYLRKSRISQNQQKRQSKLSFVVRQKQIKKDQLQKFNNQEKKRRQRMKKMIVSERINSYYKIKDQKNRKQVQRKLSCQANKKQKIQIQAEINSRRKEIEQERKNKYKKVCELQQTHKYKMQQFLIDKKKYFEQNKLIQQSKIRSQQVHLSQKLGKFKKIQNQILVSKNSVSMQVKSKHHIQEKQKIQKDATRQKSYQILKSKKQIQNQRNHNKTQIKLGQTQLVKKIYSRREKSSEKSEFYHKNILNKQFGRKDKYKQNLMNQQSQKLKELIQKNIGTKRKVEKILSQTDNIIHENQLIFPRIKQKNGIKKSYEKYKD